MHTPDTPESEPEPADPPCILVFNTNDPSGAGGLGADVTASASVGAHALSVVTGTLIRDTADIVDHYPLDEDIIAEQARTLLEDVNVQVIKVGFAGSPEALSTIAEIASDYPDLPLVAYMPNLAWWNEVQIDLYLDAFRDLLLPQTSVLVGNHSTLSRWLLPDWDPERTPTARDIARAAGEHGASYTLVTGIPAPEQFIENAIASPETTLASLKFERFEAVFNGAGDTLSATLSALLASGCELAEGVKEALSYLDRCLENGFRPGMGHAIPDRLFWAEGDDETDPNSNDTPGSMPPLSDFPPHDTHH